MRNYVKNEAPNDQLAISMRIGEAPFQKLYNKLSKVACTFIVSLSIGKLMSYLAYRPQFRKSHIAY